MNRSILIGRLTKTPELKSTQSGISVAAFTVAVNRPFSNESGEREADFIQCVVWRKQAEKLVKYCDKGSLVGIEGRIQTRSYEDDKGNSKYVTEVVCDQITFLDTKKKEEDNSGYQPDPEFQEEKVPNTQEEDLPF